MLWSPLGSHQVGVVDLEWLEPGHEAILGQTDPKKHLAGRLFYPCEEGAQRSRLLGRKGVAWLPGYNYARGVLIFLFFRSPRSILSYLLRQALQLLAFLVGTAQLMDLHPGVPLVSGSVRHPVVVFSHGLGGHRAMYSIACAEYASHGYVVLAVEHADGTASACRLAGGKGWRFYNGLGGEAGQAAKTRHRVEEMRSAHQVLLALNRGKALPGLQLSHGADPAKFLAGSLDFKCLAAVGHSYGGATVAALVAEDPLFRCAVALDPWWYAMPPETAALKAWQTRAPLAVLSSHDWSVPGPSGGLPCCEGRQAAVLEAAKARRTDGVVAGGGSLLLVIAGSSHNTFADPLPLLSQPLGWVLAKLGLSSRLDPVLGIHLTTTATLNFLSTHLPLTLEQRAMQSWEPSKSHGALDKIKQCDVADQARTGLFATVLPRGKGLIDAGSDYLLDRVLRHAVKTEFVRKQNGDVNAPDDMLTPLEAFEAALPSAEPASGLHPHAPSQPTDGHLQQGGGQEPGEATAAAAAGGGGGATAGAAAGAAGAAVKTDVLARIGREYSSVVQPEEVEQYVALLGSKHIFKVEVHP